MSLPTAGEIPRADKSATTQLNHHYVTGIIANAQHMRNLHAVGSGIQYSYEVTIPIYLVESQRVYRCLALFVNVMSSPIIA